MPTVLLICAPLWAGTLVLVMAMAVVSFTEKYTIWEEPKFVLPLVLAVACATELALLIAG